MTVASLTRALASAALALALATTAHAQQQAPDTFAPLAEELSPGVVNISTTQTVEGRSGMLGQLPEDHPLREFFEQFGGQPEQERERELRSLGSGFVIDEAGYIVTNNHVVKKADEITVILQDDTQVVRPITEPDLREIEAAFRDKPDLGFISPCFIRGRTLDRGAEFLFDSEQKLYFRKWDQSSAGGHFSALLITKPARLVEAGWRFQGSEPRNDAQAARLFGRMGYLHAPFAMWLPEVPAYRGKKKTLGLKLAEKKRRCGFYPFAILAEEEARGLRQRDPAILPKAEDCLRCTPEEPPKPWAYNPLTDTGWIKLLNQVEVAIGKAISKAIHSG